MKQNRILSIAAGVFALSGAYIWFQQCGVPQAEIFPQLRVDKDGGSAHTEEPTEKLGGPIRSLLDPYEGFVKGDSGSSLEDEKLLRLLVERTRRPPANPRIFAHTNSGIQVLAMSVEGYVHLPAGCSEVLVLADGTTPTVAVLRSLIEEVLLKTAVPVDIEVLDSNTLAPVSGVKVSGLACYDFARKFNWIPNVFVMNADQLSDDFGRVRLSCSLIREWPSGLEQALTLRAQQKAEGATGRDFGQNFYSRVSRPRSQRPVQAKIGLAPRLEWTFEFKDTSGNGRGVEGSLARIELSEGGDVSSAPVDADSRVRFLAPSSWDESLIDHLLLDISQGNTLFVLREDIHFPTSTISFRRTTLPQKGKVTGISGISRDLSVGSYPLGTDFNFDSVKSGHVEHQLPFEEVEWFPVSDSGEFSVETGWIGQETCVLLRDNLTGTIVVGAHLKGSDEISLDWPGAGELVLRTSGGKVPDGVKIFCRRNGQADGVSVLLAPNADGEARILLPPKPYDVFLTWRGDEFPLRKVVVRSGRVTELLVSQIDFLELDVRVTGVLSGPLVGARVLILGGPRYRTDSNGVLRRSVLVQDGRAEVVVFYHNDVLNEFAPMMKEIQIDSGPVDFVFGESRVVFHFPSWLDSYVNPEDCVVHFGSDRIMMAQLTLSSSNPNEIVLPEGIYSAYVAVSAALGGERSSFVEFEIRSGQPVTVDFERK